jgi:hypothetical protein
MRVKTWAGLAGPADRYAGPVAWTTAARVWLLIYLPTTLAFAGFEMAVDLQLGGDLRYSSWTLAPFLGAVMFISVLNHRGRAVGRSRTSAAVTAWAVGIAAAFVADLLRHGRYAPGWISFVIAVGLSTLACGVFVAVTYARSWSWKRRLP